MKTLLKNGTVLNVFTGELLRENVLLAGDCVLGTGDYSDADADTVRDLTGCILCPGLREDKAAQYIVDHADILLSADSSPLMQNLRKAFPSGNFTRTAVVKSSWNHRPTRRSSKRSFAVSLIVYSILDHTSD